VTTTTKVQQLLPMKLVPILAVRESGEPKQATPQVLRPRAQRQRTSSTKPQRCAAFVWHSATNRRVWWYAIHLPDGVHAFQGFITDAVERDAVKLIRERAKEFNLGMPLITHAAPATRRTATDAWPVVR
jgi:hypothetical protein